MILSSGLATSLCVIPALIGAAQITSTNATDSRPHWNAGVYGPGEQVRGSDNKIYENQQAGQTVPITFSFTGVGTFTLVVNWDDHALQEGTPVRVDTSGSLPTPLVAGQTYYVKSPSTDSFNLSTTPSGGAITNGTGTGGSGSHTATTGDNFNLDPTDPANNSGEDRAWLDIGPANDWAMFDD